MQVPAREQQVVLIGPFTVDLAAREVWKCGQKIHLQEKPFEILAILLEKPNQLVTREEIQRRLWPADTFVDFEHNINTAVKKLREALGDDAEQPGFIETLPRRGYRFVGTFETPEEEDSNLEKPPVAALTKPVAPRRRWRVAFAALVIAAILFFVGMNLAGIRDRWARGKISEQDTILLADFVNKTGDPVFDDSLKPALAAELGQSPFLNLVSDRKVVATMQQMGRDTNSPITMDVARELCQRIGTKAVLNGTISSLGSHYLIDLRAVACSTGDRLAEEATEAERKEDVLKALDQASSSLRTKLGESLPSVQKFDVPFEATTSSLEALKSYSIGIRVGRENGDAPSVPFFQRAIELDPNFAMAYGGLARAHANLDQPSLALEYATTAYRLRDRVSEREGLRISAIYFYVTGEVEKEAQTYELWTTDYRRDFPPFANLSAIYRDMGRYDESLNKLREAVRLAPENVIEWSQLALTYLNLNRWDEAEATCHQALEYKLDGGLLRLDIYLLAFMRGDTAQMERQVNWAAGKPGDEDLLLGVQAETETYYGRLSRARDFSRRAVESAVRADSKEKAALWQAIAAWREAELGNTAAARRETAAALALSRGYYVKGVAAQTLIRTGDLAQARTLAAELKTDYPSNFWLKAYQLPVISAAIELNRGNPNQALVLLEPAAPYELGNVEALYPAYVRGEAYLLAHNGTAAAAEFQKLLDHRGIVLNSVAGPLAHLQIGRAYAMAGETAKAKAAYQDFLTLWKDADPEIPILKQAKIEYAKLQ